MACTVVILPMFFLSSGKTPPVFFSYAYPIVFSLYAVVLTMNLASRIALYTVEERMAILSISLLVSLVVGTIGPMALDYAQLMQSDSSYPMMLLSGLIMLLFLEGSESGETDNDEVELCEYNKVEDDQSCHMIHGGNPRSHAVLICIFFLYLIGSGLFLGLYLSDNGSLWESGDWVRFVLGALLYFGFAVYSVLPKDGLKDHYPIIVFTFICLAALYSVALFSPMWSTFCKEIILPTRPFAMVLLWGVSVNWAISTQNDPSWAASSIALPTICISGEFLNMMTLFAGGCAFSEVIVNGVLLFVSFVITALMVVWLLMKQKEKERFAMVSSEGRRCISLDEALKKMAKEYNLSNREAEVLYYLAEGNTQKKVADNMCVSINSVQTYAKSLYRKLNVHSKQELIDLVVSERRG